MTTPRTTWPAQIAVVLVLLASSMASGASGFLSWNSPLGENAAEAGYCQAATSLSGGTHRGCGDLKPQDAAGLFVAPSSRRRTVNSYGRADPATAQDGERFVQRARYWRDQLPEKHRPGVTVAVTEVDGTEVVTLYANVGNTGDLVPQRVINAFRTRVREAGSVYERASGNVHAEQLSHMTNVERGARAIGISNPSGPCPRTCDRYFTQVEWYNVYWPKR
jgi:hypothetical protein